jgi:hypothetical protein
LLRIAIEGAPAGAIDNDDDVAAFSRPARRALLAALTVVSESVHELPGGDEDRQKWLAVLIQNGGYNAKTPPMHAFSRGVRLQELSQDEAIGAPQDRCDIVRWLEEDYGLTAAEQFALGFALAAAVQAFDDEVSSEEISLLGGQRVTDLLAQLGMAEREAAALELISAPRDWYKDRFAAAESSLMDVAWRRAPFEQRPFLRWGDGHLLLLSPRAILSWLGEGFQHRVFASAERRGSEQKQKWMRYFGQLIEEYTLELARSVYPATGELRQRVHGEQLYGKNNSQKTSDIAVDAAPDLVLFEIGAGRLKESSRVAAQWGDVEADIEKLILVRMKKLNGSISAILDGQAKIPEVDPANIRGIWPVIVTAGRVVQSELLWDYIDANAAGLLTQRRVKPLTLLDLDDFEALMGMVEGGASLVNVLERKAGSRFRQFDLQQWMHNDPAAPSEQPPAAALVAQMDRVFMDVAATLGFDRETVETRKAERGLR